MADFVLVRQVRLARGVLSLLLNCAFPGSGGWVNVTEYGAVAVVVDITREVYNIAKLP